ncbi:HTH-type transcriptional regulator ChbR [[Ruminococcus] torques]|uniref:HTH-type transcriptional regulator ChbR n=1 Tax=[Ruminococcus] torques TaxID=33039 RepID=A0A564TL93_9FIRM|nr:helix-turn-helix domain-containing protein [[Ruminococcus] torques]VUX08017.1 HTH-type transcriptional regulator ChbR [[Ruminococcus] torques]
MRDGLFALTDAEKFYKQLYENGDRKLLKKPMTYAEYEQLSENRRKYYHRIEHYHETVTTNTPGNTIKEFDADGDQVEVVLHGRYGYPIMHNHAYIELVYVYSGACTHFIEDQKLLMKKGDLCILAPEAMHALAVEDEDTVVINIMMSRHLFDSSFLKILKGGRMTSDFLENILYRKKVSPYLIFPTGEDSWIQELALRIYKERKEKDYLYNESVTLYVKQIFIQLIRKYEMMAIISDPLDNSQESNIMALMGYLSVNYNHVTLKQAAQFFGYNENYLGKILMRYTGKTFSNLISELQMENAKKLLEETNMSITEISVEVGCYDSSHFTRKFKKAYGVTPNNYRKEMQERTTYK